MRVVLSRRIFDFFKHILPSPLVTYCKSRVNRFVVIAPPVSQDSILRMESFTPSFEQLRDALLKREALLNSDRPEISVILSIGNCPEATSRCLWSVVHQRDMIRLQIILTMDHSSVGTASNFMDLPFITYIPSFGPSTNRCGLRNRASMGAEAPVIFFLDSTAVVQSQGISELYNTLLSRSDAGLVGSKLIYPDGKMKDAGGYLFNDGSGTNYGYGLDEAEPSCNYVREVDYVSGLSVMVKAAVWKDLGGYDESLVRIWQQETDLALRIRNAGLQVIYQPFSVVVHYTYGRSFSYEHDENSEFIIDNKSFKSRKERMQEGHERQLAGELKIPLERPRPRVLVIDVNVPEPDKDAGSVIADWINRIFLRFGYDITFLPVNLFLNGQYGRDLQRMGVEVLYSPQIKKIETYLAANAGRFDLFFLCRYCEGGRFAELLKQLCPNTPILFNTADLHHLRLLRAAEATTGLFRKIAQKNAQRARVEELRVIDIANETILVSEYELEYLTKQGNRNNFSILPLIMEAEACVASRQGRSGIAFIGSFNHRPNVDAVHYFLAEIWCELRNKSPEIDFHIVGSNPPSSIVRLNMPGVIVHGFVHDLSAFLRQRVLTVVPLTYGAGIKGKIGSSLAAGVPCISTSIGVEGMGLKDRDNIWVEDNPVKFANAIVEVYHDTNLWELLSANGKKFVQEHYSPEVIAERFREILCKLGANPLSDEVGRQ